MRTRAQAMRAARTWPDGTRCWLVGFNDAYNTFHVVEAETVGEPMDGLQTVNTRLGCIRSAMFETVPTELIHVTEQEARDRRMALVKEQGGSDEA